MQSKKQFLLIRKSNSHIAMSVTRIALCFLLLYPTFGLAGTPIQDITGKSPCASLLASIGEARLAMNKEVAKTLQTTFAKIYENTTISVAEKSKAAFKAFLDLAVAALPETSQARVYRLLQNRQTIIADRIDGYAESIQETVQVVLPKSMHGTELEYLFLAHEITHVIDFEIARKIVGNDQELLSLWNDSEDAREFFAEFSFGAELSPMASEFYFLQALPRVARERMQRILLEEVQRTGNESIALMLQLVLPNFTEIFPNPSTYVQFNWSLGRNTYEGFSEMNARLNIKQNQAPK